MKRLAFGKRVNDVRKEQKITSEGLAEKCGVEAVFIRQIEGATRLPSLTTLINLCNALHVSPNYLLADSLEPNEQENFDALWKKLRSLTPKQIDMVTAMIETLINKLED